MENFNGISLRFNVVEERVSYYAIAISDIIASTSIYKELSKKLPSPRLLLYFRYIIKKEIYPYVWQACVLEWCEKNNISNVLQKKEIKIPNFGVYKLLLSCWDFSVPLETSWKEN